MNEVLLNKVKKLTTPQLLAKVEKAKGEEKEAMISVLSSRGQDVSKWSIESGSAVVSPEERIAEKRQLVDDYVDELVSVNNSTEYAKIVIALGGTEDSDYVHLLQGADEAALDNALAVKAGAAAVPPVKAKKEKAPKPEKVVKVKASKPEKVKKEKAPKKEKVAKVAKVSPTDDSKSAEILKLLQAGELSKYAIAKKLNTYYSVVDYVAKRYLATTTEAPVAENPVTAVPGTAE